MDPLSYLIAAGATLLAVGALLASARRIRLVVFAGSGAALALLVDSVVATTLFVWLGQILGSLGWLARGPIVVSSLVILGGVVVATRSQTRPSSPPPARSWPRRHWPAAAAAGAVGLVALRWTARALEPFPSGIAHADVLHYHAPMAAIWAKTGETWPVSFWSIGDASAYHPGNAELLHAFGLVLFGNDFLSFFVNIPFVAVALAAGFLLGARRGNAAAGVIIVSAVFVLRFMTAEAGQILNDAIPVCFVIVAAALLDEARDRRDQAPMRWIIVGGLAGGLAVGAKLTVVVPVVGLAVAAAVAVRPRGRAVLCYMVPALATGGYWYLRNLVHAGSPIPAFQHSPFPGPSFPELTKVEHSVFDYLGDRAIWQDYFLPGLRSSLGPLWPIIPALTLLGAASVVLSRRTRRSDPVAAVLAVVALVTFVSYVFNPASAAGSEGDPWVFRANVRYFFPSLALGGLAALGHPWLRRRPALAVGAASVLLIACALYAPDTGNVLVALVALVALLAVTGSLVILARSRRSRPAVIAGAAVLALGFGFVAQHEYFERRWTDTAQSRWKVYDTAQDLDDARIAVTGQPQSYPFYGEELDNEVFVVGRERDGVYEPIVDCGAWWRAVRGFRADYVAVLSHPKLLEVELGRQTIVQPLSWLEASSTEVVEREPEAILFDVRDATPDCT